MKDNNPGKLKWLKRLGIWGFIFFLLKGLFWIGLLLFAWLGWID